MGADVRLHDSHVGVHPVDRCVDRVELTAEELAHADAVILVTDHDDIDYGLVLQHATYVFDSRNRLTAPNVEHL